MQNNQDRATLPIAVRDNPTIDQSSIQSTVSDATAAEPTTLPAVPKAIINLLPYQRADIENPQRFLWNCWARQTGKSFTKTLRRLLRGIERRRNQILLSAGERQSRELMEKVRQHCRALEIAADYYEIDALRGISFRQMEIRLPSGVRIIALPANPRTVRGFTGDVLLDEFAMHEDDRDIYAAIFPSVLRGQGELDIASTPRGRGNMFDLLRDNPQFHHSTLTLPDAVAQGLPVDVQTMREAIGDDELFRQEFLCEFIDEAAAFLSYDQINRCVDATLQRCDNPTSLASAEGELFVGVDIGRKRDLTVMWVLARQHDFLRTVAIIELSSETFARQFAVLEAIMTHRSVRRCVIDAGGLGMQLAEQTTERFGAARVEPVIFTPSLRSQIATSLRIAVEAERIRIPPDERIIQDWHSVERGMTPAGHFRLLAPRREGSHADRFWAAALAVYAVDAMPAAQPLEAMFNHAVRFPRGAAW